MNPERPIERLLRQAAGKRRAEAGDPEPLHPATRRLLQSEVARHHAQAAPATRPEPESWLRFWPRLAWTTAVVAVLGSFLWLGLHRDSPKAGSELAFRPDAPARAEEALPAPAEPVPAIAGGGSGAGSAGIPALEVNAPVAVAAAAPPKPEMPAALRPATAPVVQDGAMEVAAAPAGAPFSNQASLRRAKSAAPPAFEVLNTFAVEQAGPELRIVDADGSVYVGQVDPPLVAETATTRQTGSAAARTLGKAQTRDLSAGVSPEAGQNYSFRVAGFNRSLNQKVEFAGLLQAIDDGAAPAPVESSSALQAAGAPVAARGTGGGFGGAASVRQEESALTNQSRQFFRNQARFGIPLNTQSNLQAVRNQAPDRNLQQNLRRDGAPDLQRARINGRAVIGGKQELDVDAVPQSR